MSGADTTVRSSAALRGDVAGLARRGLLSLVGSGISALAGLALIGVVTRGTDKASAGALFTVISLFVIVEGLCVLGTTTGLVYFVARLRALGQAQGVADVTRVALVPVVAVSLVVALAGILGGPWVAAALGVGEGSTTSVRVLAAFLPVAAVYDVLLAGTQGFHTMRPTVLVEKIGRPTAQVALLVIAAAAGPSWSLAPAWVAPYLPGLVWVAVSFRRLLGRDRSATRPTAREVAPSTFWRYSAPRGVAAAGQLSLQRLDIILVALYLGPREAAIYTAATRFVVLGQLGSQAIALVVQPAFSSLLATGDVEAADHVYKTSTGWVMAVTWPVHLVVAVLAEVLLGFFGDGYSSGAAVVVVLAASMLVATGCGMVTMVLLMAGRSAANLLNVAVALTTNLVLDLVLIPRLGIEGAAVAWAVAIVLSNLLPLLQVRHALAISPFGRPALVVGALAAVLLGLPPGAVLLSGAGPAVLVLVTAIGLGLYAAALWRFRAVLELDGLLRTRARH